jgi:1,4-dihydroxy-2-naphthoate polyprenyltransferase
MNVFENGWQARKKWLRLLRPHTLTASITPVLIGTALSFQRGRIDWTLFGAMLLASILIQSAVNMFNEYFDFKRGLDTEDSVGIGGVIVRNEISGRAVLRMAEFFFAVSVFLGIYICTRTSWWVAAAGSISMSVGYLYSGGRSPIAYSRFGELAAGIFMGLLIVVISFYIQTGLITANSIILSVPISILVAAILLANNIRDADGDVKKGRRTLAIQLGQTRATSFLSGMFITSFVLVASFVILRIVTPYALISIASALTAVRSIKGFRNKRTAAEMLPAMKDASILHLQFGILFTFGIILGRLFSSN